MFKLLFGSIEEARRNVVILSGSHMGLYGSLTEQAPSREVVGRRFASESAITSQVAESSSAGPSPEWLTSWLERDRRLLWEAIPGAGRINC